MFLIAGVIHFEIRNLLCGIMYWFLLPCMYLLLMIFAFANMHDQSWGTRESCKLSYLFHQLLDNEKEDGVELFNLRRIVLEVIQALGWYRDVKKPGFPIHVFNMN